MLLQRWPAYIVASELNRFLSCCMWFLNFECNPVIEEYTIKSCKRQFSVVTRPHQVRSGQFYSSPEFLTVLLKYVQDSFKVEYRNQHKAFKWYKSNVTFSLYVSWSNEHKQGRNGTGTAFTCFTHLQIP